MALFKVVNNQAQLDAGDVASTDVYGAGIRFTQDGAARTTRFAGTAFNQGIPMSPTGQVAIVDATSGLPVDAIYLNGLPISGNKVCVSLNASSVISSGLPFDSNGVLVGSLSGFTTLSLDFTGSTTLDPRITFSRTSNATLTDSNGRVAYAPHNLLTNSEDFEAAAWTKFNVSVTSNTGVAPDGTTTADKQIPVAANVPFKELQQNVSITSGVTYTLSEYVKADGYRYIQIVGNSAVFGTFYINYDLQTGTETAFDAGSSTVVGRSITNVGNGWYRVSASVTAISTASGRLNVDVIPAFDSIRGVSWASDGTSGIFIWGAQLNVGALQSYNSTTPKNLLGFTQEFDNAAWTKSNSFVQTNLLTWSEQFNNAIWLNTGTTTTVVTPNTQIAPDGTLTADTITFGGTTGGDRIFQDSTTNSVNGTAVTGSVWLRAPSTRTLQIFIERPGPADTEFTTVTVTTEWQRFTFTHSSTWTGSGSLRLRLAGASVAGDYYAWGAQLVQGSVPGDYQVTTSAAAAVQYSDPNGTRTADKLVENTTLNFHFAAPASPIATISGTPSTLSVYMKAGERRYGGIHHQDGTAKGCSVDLLTGTLGTPYGGATAQLASLGSGWYRLSVTATLVGANTPAIYVSDTNSLASYTGDGTSGIYIWGAQLSNSASVDSYVYNPQAAPTSTAYYGPRFDYNPVTLAANGLLIEEQRTNLLTYSEDFSGATGWSNLSAGVATVVTNDAVAPDGTTTADKITFGGTNTYWGKNATFVNGTSYAGSLWVKTADGGADFTISLTFYPTGGGTQQNITVNVTNVWTRVTALFPSITNGSGASYFAFVTNTTRAIHAWGAQLEAGSFATSYIPTQASQVTRAADNASMLGDNFATWYNQTQGTIYASVIANNANGNRVLSLSGGPNPRLIDILTVATPNRFAYYTSIDATQNNIVTTGSIGSAKLAVTYSSSGTTSTQNGATPLVGTTTSAATIAAQVTRMEIGAWNSSSFLNGTIRGISFYPTALPSATLQSITA